VSTFWYGDFFNRTANGWTQVEEDFFTDGDSAMSFTWQGIALAPGAAVAKSVIVRFGPFESSHVTLAVSFPDLSEVPASAQVSVTGSVTVSPPATAPRVAIFAQVGSTLYDVPGNVANGVPFNVAFTPASIGLTGGSSTVTFFAVDADGDVSEGHAVTITVVGDDSSGGDSASSSTTKTVVAVLGGIAGAGVVGGLFVFFLCHGKKRDQDGSAIGSNSASGTDGLKAYMADELLPG
jgi:hypothetical protein